MNNFPIIFYPRTFNNTAFDNVLQTFNGYWDADNKTLVFIVNHDTLNLRLDQLNHYMETNGVMGEWDLDSVL